MVGDPAVRGRMLNVAAAWGGPAEVVARWRWPHGESEVARVRTAEADVIVKWVRSGDRFSRELRAVRDFCPALADNASQLLHADSDAQVLVLTFVPGRLASTSSAQHDPAIHEQAGRLIAVLHDSAEARTDHDYAARLACSYDGWPPGQGDWFGSVPCTPPVRSPCRQVT